MSGEIELTLDQLLDEINGESLTLARINQLLQGITVRVSADAVTAREIADGSIGADKLESDISAQIGIPNNSISTAKLVDRSVTGAKIALDGVAAENINSDVAGDGLSQAGDGSLDVYVDGISLELSGGKVQVKDDGVTTARILDAAVTAAKLATDAKPQLLQAVNTDDDIVSVSTWTDVPDLSQAITPHGAGSKVLVTAVVNLGSVSATYADVAVRVLRGVTVLGVGDDGTPVGVWARFTGTEQKVLVYSYLDSPATGSEVTYKVQVTRNPTGNVYVNEIVGEPLHGISTLTVQEVLG